MLYLWNLSVIVFTFFLEMNNYEYIFYISHIMVMMKTFKSALEQMVALEQNRPISCQIQLPVGWKTESVLR